MGTKVMVRATRSFNGRVEGDWYWVDPDNPHEAALIKGGYYAHQEDLIEGLPVEVAAAVEYPGLWTPPDNRQERLDAVLKLYEPEGKTRGEVGAEPDQHPQDGAGEGAGAGDPDSAAGAGRGEEDSPE